MKRIVKAYISFTRPEKLGLVLLASALILLITVRATMHLWVKPEDAAEKEGKLLAAWQDFKRSETAAPAITYNKPYVPHHDSNTYIVKAPVPYHLFRFDPNTLDSAGFRKLGLSANTTAILLHWRNKGKIFRKKEELKGLYTLTPEEYTRLEPYIVIKQ